ncbi:glycosyltransferase family 2 protein [Rhizobium sp. BG4]|uniref:glycosyltransferase family 2 protein n=1 Tax=Rhizobium sp. BG4 TaxID=2613770 RepID=UPI00193DD746|nr:glycosyltransferase family 2 protein [Rhizobium sp. BG4]QRM43186.1 glycosyltransferase [Rhizobium sp. BG4]
MRIGEYAPGGAINGARENHGSNTQTISAAAEDDDLFRTEARVLLELGIGKPMIAEAVALARANGTSIEEQLLASGWLLPENYYAGLARMLRLDFVETLDPDLIYDIDNLDSQLLDPRMLKLHHMPQSMNVIVPQARQIPALQARLAARPDLRPHMQVTTPSEMRRAVWERGAQRRVRQSVNTLFDREPDMSARIVLLGKQGFVAGVAVTALAAGILASADVLLLLHLFVSLFYLAAMAIRFLALAKPAPRFNLRAEENGPLPIYTVMVGLYREAAVAEQLAACLKRLNWPVSKLDIKLVCEADDRETIAALKAQDLGPHFEIVEVPAARPRTKPKALNYALTSARGKYLAVYDAEDRPHPDQLREAHATFLRSPDDIVCLQAPLVIANARDSWISAAFALEYSALFRMLLPVLAMLRLPMPLGGTSNHFKTKILKDAGGWDPHNVTEDADLGMRLYRRGYRCGVLSSHTLEDAPSTAKTWLHQRTRWFKGWLQTWLVLMRDPAQLLREMGISGFVVFQLLIAGMLLSALAHPWMLFFIGSSIIDLFQQDAVMDPAHRVLLVMDSCNVIASYILFILLGRKRMTPWEKRALRLRWLALPLYWMMLSIAAWRAVWQLRSNPFFWEKTPHAPSRKAA